MQPTAEQRAICDFKGPRGIVEANAGAGKTTTAAMKIASLVKDGADPAKIVALSFTQPGVQAYADAFRRLGVGAALAKAVRVGTFEEFCAARLKRLDGGDVVRLTRPEQVRPFVLAAIPAAREWMEPRYPGEFAIAGPGEFAVEGLLRDFAHIKGTLQLLREADGLRFHPAGANELGRDLTTLSIYRAYEHQRCHFLDADGEHTRFRYAGDATYDLARHLAADDPVFSWDTHPLRLGLEAVVLDEMHDTNWAMFTVLKDLLAVNDGAHFLGVGDRDQVIHAEAGADAYFMGEGFDRHVGPARRFPLSSSRRFGKAVAQPLAVFSGKPYPADPELASRVEVRQAGTTGDLLAIVNDAVTRRPGLRRESHLSDIAVLLRHPSEAVELEHELRRRGIKYEAVGFTTYLQRPEVLFLRLIFMAAVGLQEQLGRDALAGAKRAAWEFIGGSLRTPADDTDPTASHVESWTQPNFVKEAIPMLLATTADASARTQVRQAMQLAGSDQARKLVAAVGALDMKTLARRVFVNRQAADAAQASAMSFARAGEQYESISAFLRSLIAHDYEAHTDKLARNRIRLSSIEAAKGLEFDHVIVPEVNRGGFDGARGDDRNLFYVSASRARQLLTLTCRPGQGSSYLGPFLGAAARA